MTFWESIRDLRRHGVIPRQWRVEDIRRHLQDRFAKNTISTVPWNQSMTRNGKILGDYVKRRGRPAEAYRVREGVLELIDDPGED